MEISQPVQTPRSRDASVFDGKCFFLMSTLKLGSHSLAIAPCYTAWCYSATFGSIVLVSILQTVTDFRQIPLSLPFARLINPSTTSLSVYILRSTSHCRGCCLLDPLQFLHFCHELGGMKTGHSSPAEASPVMNVHIKIMYVYQYVAMFLCDRRQHQKSTFFLETRW